MTRSQRPNAPAIDEPEQGLSREELEAMEIVALPEREALSVAISSRRSRPSCSRDESIRAWTERRIRRAGLRDFSA
jgi:hypothetical protein